VFVTWDSDAGLESASGKYFSLSKLVESEH
jgi:hypothetical protein